MKCKLLLCFICILFSTAGFMAHAQNKVTIIKGKITGKDGVPLPGVSVMLKGKPVEGVVTDAEGNYTLRVKRNLGYDCIYLGRVQFERNTVQRNHGVIDVKLEETVSVLNDVILTGYIKQRRVI